tara:strand:+ start:1521 stop:3818 length:2298 start_codon:yes stop_codon:yes gene_type:complete
MTIKRLYILFFSLVSNLLFGQISFIQDNNIPIYRNNEILNNAWAGGMNFCQFSSIDLNLDGINDLFVFDKSGKNGTSNGNRIIPFLFDVESNNYKYSPEYISLFPELYDWCLMVDYNGDEKVDIFTSYESSIALYTNNSDDLLSFNFTKVLTSDAGFGQLNIYVSNSDIPAIIDVDGDTDVDILTFDPSGSHMYFHENKSIQMYGNSDSINLVRSDNCWGRFKEDFNTNSVTLGLNEDCNEEEEGRFAHSGSTVLALELDPNNNQGLELILGDITYDNMIMLHNGGSNENAIMINQDLNFPSYNNSINLTRFPGAYHLDLDNDNLKDLIISPNGVNVSENYKNVLFYKNTGNTSDDNMIEFEFIQNDFLVEEMIDVGTNACPLLYDLNNDNLLDLIISNKGYFDNGNYNSKLSIYKNIGTELNPVFEFISDDFANLSETLGSTSSIQSLHPTFGDTDNDGDTDMIIGDNNGELYHFINEGTSSSEWPEFNEYETMNIDIGSFATPQLVDLNRDGLLDLIIGERSGVDNGIYNGINYYQNTGSSNNPIYEDYTPEYLSGEFDNNGEEIIIKSLGGIHLADPTYLTAYTLPYIFEHNNMYYLAVGTESGLIYLYDNIESVFNNQYSLNLTTNYSMITNNLLNVNNCVHSKITIHDINNDGNPDLIRGNASGGIEMFIGENFNTYNEIIQENNNIKITPNPNNGNFKIVLPDNLNYSLRIYSMLGTLLMEKNIQNKSNINIENYNPGLYLIEINRKNISLLKSKIIVN